MRTAMDTGRRGERLAARWVTLQGAQVVFTNLRMGPLEIDLAARDAEGWVLYEVKTLRAATEATEPEWQLRPAKCRSLRRALAAFDHCHNPEGLPLRLDLLAVLLLPGGGHLVRHYPDAVRP